jgi:hypothetical protein
MSGAPEIKWAVDAWFILARRRNFDWPTFAEATAAPRLELPVYHALRCMSEHLGAAVPLHVLEQLGAGAARAGFLERQAARPWFVAPDFYRLARYLLLKRRESGDGRGDRIRVSSSRAG